MLQIKVKAGELKSLYGQYKKRLETSNEGIKDYFQSGQALDNLLAAFDESKQERVLYATRDSWFLSGYRYKTVYTWNYNIVCVILKWRRDFGCIPETSPFWGCPALCLPLGGWYASTRYRKSPSTFRNG